MLRYCLTLDLIDEPSLISAYEHYHERVWPEVLAGIKHSGIYEMEIYRHGARLFMIMETTDEFSFEFKAEIDQASPRIQEWETLMWNYQQAIPGSKPGEKWILMKRIFALT